MMQLFLADGAYQRAEPAVVGVGTGLALRQRIIKWSQNLGRPLNGTGRHGQGEVWKPVTLLLVVQTNEEKVWVSLPGGITQWFIRIPT